MSPRTRSLGVALTVALIGLSSARIARAADYEVPGHPVGCSKLVEDFCDALWAPKALGNLEIKNSGASFQTSITLGRTSNETYYLYALFLEARLGARLSYPKELREQLENRKYFDKLKHILEHKPYAQMTEMQVEEIRALWAELDSIWAGALENAASARVSRTHLGFFRLPEEKIPTVVSHAYSLAKDEIEAASWQAVWANHPRWKAINESFDQVKATFLELVRNHPSVAPEIKKRWEDRIKGARLIIPASDPVRLNESERRCASTELNAYHWPEKNAVVLCGGYILTGDPARTFAHELAHSLGEYRADYEGGLRFPLAKHLAELRNRTCTKLPYDAPPAPSGTKAKPLGCAEWQEWKKQYSLDLAEATATEEQSSQYLACFETKKLKGSPPASTLDYIAREWVQSELEAQARRDRFIRLTKEKETLRDGSVHPSEAYLDPCALYYIYYAKDPYSPEFTLNTFFVNEYRCEMESSRDHCTRSPEICLEAAIEGAEALEYQLRRRALATQTKHSPIRELQRQGYAEDVEEDLADHLGQLAFAKYLTRFSDARDRRTEFLGTMAPLCDEPSIAKLYPAEALVQKKYYIEAHSEGLDRRRKLLIQPIREALRCDKDFETAIRDCDWYRP